MSFTQIAVTLGIAVAAAAAIVYANNKGYFPQSPFGRDTGERPAAD